MRKWIQAVVAVVLCLGIAGCCTHPKEHGKPCSMKKCPAMCKGASIDKCPAFAKLNLTDAQKPQVQKIRDECMKAGCTKESCDKMMKDLEGVLTPEQMTQFKACCKPMKEKGGCCAKGAKTECPMAKPSEAK